MAYAQPPLEQLFLVKPELRDSEWEEQFLKAFPKHHVHIVHPDPKPGPDGWPYLLVESAPATEEPVSHVLEWLSTRGIGLVLNPQKESPDFVFSYGMIWNFRERGSFLSPAPERKAGTFQLQPGSQVLTGAPSESFLPKYARTILKQFFLDQGVFTPKVLLMSEDKKSFDLCFSLESLGEPPVGEHMGIAEAVSWFLPAHYSVALVSERAIEGFEPL